MKCCLCGEEIEVKGNWKEGNNAQPIKDGRCCDFCNYTKVIPLRFSNFASRKRKGAKQQ